MIGGGCVAGAPDFGTVARLPPIRGGQAVELVCGGCPGGLVSSVAVVVWQRARDGISRYVITKNAHCLSLL